MALALSNMKESSEESRQKRAVRRYLNKKKRPVDEEVVDEGSEESRQRRAKRFNDKKKKDKPLDEEIVRVNSQHHMMHAVEAHHNHGMESPNYHIHRIGVYEGPSASPTSTHRYLVVSKHSVQHEHGHKFPTHLFNLWKEPGHDGRPVTHLVHRQIVE